MSLLFLAQAAPPPADETNLLLWAVALLAGGFVLLVLELFLPSGGLLGITAAAAAVAAVACFFAVSPALGFAAFLGLAVVTPVLLGIGLKIWPHTPVGRRLILGGAGDGPAGGETGGPAETAGFHPAAGDRGETLTPLRRVGTCRFGDRRVECLAESGMVAAGVRVVVSRVSGHEVFVRATEPSTTADREPPTA